MSSPSNRTAGSRCNSSRSARRIASRYDNSLILDLSLLLRGVDLSIGVVQLRVRTLQSKARRLLHRDPDLNLEPLILGLVEESSFHQTLATEQKGITSLPRFYFFLGPV